jgi:hypothetical protein
MYLCTIFRYQRFKLLRSGQLTSCRKGGPWVWLPLWYLVQRSTPALSPVQDQSDCQENPLQNKNLFCICVTEKWLCHIGTEFVGHTISAILWIHVQPFLKFFLLANVIGMCVGIEGKYVFQYYFKLLSWTCKFTLPSSFG